MINDLNDFALEDMVAHLRESGINYGDNYVYPAGLEHIRTLGNLTQRMVRRGFTADDIAKVLGGNLLRVFRRVVDERETT